MSASGFNKDQLKAINHKTGPAMIIAGPGSGKTTVITNRIKRLTDDGTAQPSEILVITFTSAAAEEMKARYLKLSSSSDTEVCFGTFHSVFFHLLRQIPKYRKLRLAEPQQSIEIIRTLVGRYYPDRKFTADYYPYLLNEISLIKSGCGQIRLMRNSKLGREAAFAADIAKNICAEYDRIMHDSGLMDYEDMLVMCLDVLRKSPKLLAEVRERRKFIMIDEFQDIDPIQFEIVRLIAAPLNNIFVVGDDDQSIYGFRGSEPSIMLDFGKYYPGAVFTELFTNYRSSEPIVRSAERLISHNKLRYDKHFNTVNPCRLPVYVSAFGSREEEARWIAEDISRLPDNIGEIGILYRTHRTGRAVKDEIAKLYGGTLSKKTGNKKISLMSFHASKGLEFDIVYIISANEGITPSSNAGAAGIEEERRLFYVAMTRARRIIHISYTRSFYNKKQKMSRFVREAVPFVIFKVIKMRQRQSYIAH